jgi:KipI family sensor histidine kinase inhibitor
MTRPSQDHHPVSDVLVHTFGDGAVLVDLGEPGAGHGNRLAHVFAEAVRELASVEPGLGSPVPGLGSVLVPIDPDRLTIEHAIATLGGLATATAASANNVARGTATRLVEVPTVYGGRDGPDLEAVAAETGLAPADVIEAHASVEYEVLFLGFAPGFAYLGALPERLVVPRLSTPRPRVPAGSVGIAARQTAIYPHQTPGGWRLIGRTDLALWDSAREPPALIEPGCRVRFVPR